MILKTHRNKYNIQSLLENTSINKDKHIRQQYIMYFYTSEAEISSQNKPLGVSAGKRIYLAIHLA